MYFYLSLLFDKGNVVKNVFLDIVNVIRIYFIYMYIVKVKVFF